MTNCIYTRHQGKKTEKDISYCLKTFENITKEEWLKMCGKNGEKLGSDESLVEIPNLTEKIKEGKNIKKIKAVIPSQEDLRKLREKYYS